MLALQNAPAESLEIQGLRLRPLAGSATTARFDLTFTLEEQDGRLAGAVEYATDLFDAPTVDRLIGHWEGLLAAAVEAPHRWVTELPLMPAAERHQLLTEWNDTAVEPEDALVHELFEAWVRRTPEAPAAACDGETLTYAALDARAERLAHRLRGLCRGPQARVGIALERSLDLVVALLGVLKAGATYVPLDPSYPRERLALVLEDAAPRVSITETHLLPALPADPGPLLCLDTEPDSVDGSGPSIPMDPRQLAYVLFTSGSTGRPKGVGVPHRALVNFLASMRRVPGFVPGEKLLAVTSISFDIAALEIFLPLTTGGCVELATRDEAADGTRLAARLRTSKAGVMQATPATWRMLLDAGWTGDSRLRAFCGGEALPRDLAATLAASTRELWNLYGPTETTVWSAAACLRPEARGPIPVGRPIANTRILLLDREMRPVPLGVTGELWIGGDGLALGYLGRPDLAAERFLPDPFAAEGGEPGGRLYRTGDLARHLPSGQLEVLGRIDHQIKLRGFRIELGEIEAALTSIPEVREAVVVVREDSGDRRLVAYLVGEASDDTLRRFLRERLPDYMVPSVFVTLAAMPLTPNGKVDRKALPAPEQQHAGDGYVPPRTPDEEMLAGIWAELLGREQVGATDHFFDLGGHSLLAARLVAAVRDAFQVDLPLRLVFERPTVEGLARAISEAGEAGAPVDDPVVPIPREPGDNRFPVSFSQLREWILDRLEPGNPAYNIPSPLRIEGPLAVPFLIEALHGIVRRHEVFRTRFAAGPDEQGPEPLQVVLPKSGCTSR